MKHILVAVVLVLLLNASVSAFQKADAKKSAMKDTKAAPEKKAMTKGVAKTPPVVDERLQSCLLYTSPSPRDLSTSRMPSSA